MVIPLNETDELRIRRELSELKEAQEALLKRVSSLENTSSETTDVQRAAGDNMLRNCLAQFSDDAYNDLGLGGDAAERLAHWYIHAAATTLLGLTTAEMLKSSAHSGYVAGTDDPDWGKSAGQIRLGTTKTVSQPLINRFAQRGATLYLQFSYTLRTATALPAGLKFYAGLWDNTPGQEKWISGATLALTIAVQGTPGATTRQYRVIVTTDTGETYQIDAAAIANAPNTPSVANYVRVSWPAIPGRVSARVEKLQGGVYSLLTTIVSGSTDYNDYGDAGTVIGAFSTGTLTALRARVEDPNFAPEYGVIKRKGYAIEIPSDYDFALTTAEQVLRVGLSAALTDDHQLLLTRFQMGFSFGDFQLSAFDLAIVNAGSSTAPPVPPTPPGDEDIPCFSDNVCVRTPEGLRSFAELAEQNEIRITNRTGTHRAELLVHEFDGVMIDMGVGTGRLVTLEHLFEREFGRWHTAAEQFPTLPRIRFKGRVYNLHILSDDPADYHYIIKVVGHGREYVVHNAKILT